MEEMGFRSFGFSAEVTFEKKSKCEDDLAL